MFKKTLCGLMMSTIVVAGFASSDPAAISDTYLPGISQNTVVQWRVGSTQPIIPNPPYTLLSYSDYQKTLASTEQDLTKMIAEIGTNNTNVNDILQVAQNYLQKVPYNGGMGEGDWCNAGLTKTGCMHIQQNLMYRTDELNCTTFVQLVLALINANNLSTYNANMVKIAYGAEANAGYTPGSLISYANRNNFTDGDFNPVNQKSGLLTDVSGAGVFASYVKTVPANITRATWFYDQYKPAAIANNVQVFTAQTGWEMADRFANNYGNFYRPETVNTPYIPKSALVNVIAGPGNQTSYIPNENLINQIPTPSVVEVIRDDTKWSVNGVNIVNLIGSGTAVSHIAFLYRQNFNLGATIYQKVNCQLNTSNAQVCSVAPVVCTQNGGCTETMMLAATDAYPDGYLWTHNSVTNQYNCVAPGNVPAGSSVLTTCNRVSAMPFGDYVTYQYDNAYIYMTSPSIVGFNIQKINS